MSQNGFRSRLWTVISFLVLGSLVWIPSAQAAYTISGSVFRDYNANGIRDLNEPGVGAVQVTAYNTAGPVISAASDSLGNYSLTIPTDEPVRIEFTPTASFVFAGAAGTNNASSVVFVSAARTLDYGLSIPGDYCQQNPGLATNCYVQGDQAGANQATESTMLRTPYTSSGLTPTIADLALAGQIGTTWGLGYQRTTDTLFAGAFLKRHAGYGPAGTGAIYAIRGASTAAPTASLFLDLNVALGGAIAGPGRPNGTNYQRDSASFTQVGKVALGDVDVSEDDQTLWAVNLASGELYRIPIGTTGVAPAPAAIGRYNIPTGACAVAADARPFGLGMFQGLVYVGVICSAESSQDVAQLRAQVYSFNPQSSAFSGTPIVDIPLNYPRGCVDRTDGKCPAEFNAGWKPWLANNLDFASFAVNGQYITYPQPMLTDIVFDNGAMVLGLRDRFGDQSGRSAFSPIAADLAGNYTGFAAGDILRLCPSGASWTLESNASCGGVATSGAGTNQGPGNGEFYYQEDHPNHDEIAMGGLAQVPGAAELASTVFDPIFDVNNTFETGIRWLNNTTGMRDRSARLRAVSNNPLDFGKANGLGDLEALCNAAPVEIGNRVWLDSDKDGVQDADEPAIPGVTVELVNAQGTVIATAITDADGHYYFSNDPNRNSTTSSIYQISGLRAGENYTVRIPLNQAALNSTFVTLQTNDTSANGTIRDSDGDNTNAAAGVGTSGYTQVAVPITGIGQNRHSYDFGFSSSPTAIVLSRFSAIVQGGGIMLEWATALEANSFGFAIMRSNTPQRADAVLVTPSLIRASGGIQGASYSWWDQGGSETAFYWLVEVQTDGQRIEYGPFQLRTSATDEYTLKLPLITR